MNFLRKLFNALSTLVVIAVVFLAVALVGVRLVGLTPYAVLSGSMEPTYHVGSLIYVKDIAPEEIQVGTPITFVVNEDLLLATHRVVGVEAITEREETVKDENGNPLLDENGKEMTHMVTLEEPTYYFQTKGDANDDVDGAPVHHKNVVGTPIFSIPLLGYLSNWLQSPKGMIMGASIALVLVMLTFLPDILDLVDDEPKQAKGKKGKKPQKKSKKRRIPKGAKVYTVKKRGALPLTKGQKRAIARKRAIAKKKAAARAAQAAKNAPVSPISAQAESDSLRRRRRPS